VESIAIKTRKPYSEGLREMEGLLKAESVICKTKSEHFENKNSTFSLRV
jgi:hypothetical protein